MGLPPNKKIAIIGSGISGLGAAWLLHPHHKVTLYEKNAYLGGHSRTLELKVQDQIVPVDTGFIVFNKRNYPLLTRLFEELKVPIAPSSMSFGVSIDGGRLEYSTQTLQSIFAQKRNLFRPAFWGMLADILKFHRKAGGYLAHDPSFTLGDCLDALKMGRWFRQYFLQPMGAAIWSTPTTKMLEFPASSLIRFFENHGLLSYQDHPQWYTVQGGSREYVRRLSAPFKDSVRLGAGIAKVWRTESGVVLEDQTGLQQTFDHVVFACHADQALGMMLDPSPNEKAVLSAFRYQSNRALLHSDTSFMPKRRQAWASWVYHTAGKQDDTKPVSLSYWMNNLQPLATQQTCLVTLNPAREPSPNLVYDDYLFEHPLFDRAAILSQAKLDQIQGRDRFWFCGAYQRYGFHEDGLSSAVKMAEKMGVSLPW